MSLDQLLRNQLTEATTDVVGGPSLDASIRSGRRRRRVRAVSVGAGGVAVAAGASLAVASTLSGGASTHGPTGKAHELAISDSPTYTDFVAGSTVDETIEAAVAANIPGMGEATDVYPSDWNRDTPLPDAQFANATDWEARYDVSGHEAVVMVMGFPVPYENNHAGCPAHGGGGTPGCTETDLPGGAKLVSNGYSMPGVGDNGENLYVFLTTYQSADGFSVIASDRVLSDSWAHATGLRQTTDDELAALAGDSTMTFPDPATWPPSKRHQR